jgi:hypothetical protein
VDQTMPEEKDIPLAVSVMLHINRKQVEKNDVLQLFMKLIEGNCRKKIPTFTLQFWSLYHNLMSMQSTMPTLYYSEASYKQQK